MIKIPERFFHCPRLAAGDCESPSLEAIHNLFRFQRASSGIGGRGEEGRCTFKSRSIQMERFCHVSAFSFAFYESHETDALGAQNISPGTYIPCKECQGCAGNIQRKRGSLFFQSYLNWEKMKWAAWKGQPQS